MEETQTCSKCGKRKPLDQFYRNRRKSNNRRSACKACEYPRIEAFQRSPEGRQRRSDWYKERYANDLDFRRKEQEKAMYAYRKKAGWYDEGGMATDEEMKGLECLTKSLNLS